MPHQWLPATGAAMLLHLWPHRSLPRRGFGGRTVELGAVELGAFLIEEARISLYRALGAGSVRAA